MSHHPLQGSSADSLVFFLPTCEVGYDISILNVLSPCSDNLCKFSQANVLMTQTRAIITAHCQSSMQRAAWRLCACYPACKPLHVASPRQNTILGYCPRWRRHACCWRLCRFCYWHPSSVQKKKKRKKRPAGMALLSVSSNNNEQVVWGECAKAAESNPTVSRSPNSKPRRSRIPNRGRTCWSTAGVNGPMHRQNWCADIHICDSLHTLESLPLCHWSALPSCGHTTMSKYTATTLCVYICLCVTEIGIQTGREMEVWAPVALYLSPNSHMKCRQGGKKVSSLGLNGDPHPRFNHTPRSISLRQTP